MMKIIRKGGQTVPKGNYWNIANGDRVRASGETVLPGTDRATYVRVHPLLVVMAAPLLGLAYAAFLPFIGMAMLVVTIGRKLGSVVLDSAAKSATFTWQPSEAYLAHKRKAPKAEKTTGSAQETAKDETKET